MSKVLQVRELPLNDSNRFNHFIIIMHSLIIETEKKLIMIPEVKYAKKEICCNIKIRVKR